MLPTTDSVVATPATIDRPLSDPAPDWTVESVKELCEEHEAAMLARDYARASQCRAKLAYLAWYSAPRFISYESAHGGVRAFRIGPIDELRRGAPPAELVEWIIPEHASQLAVVVERKGGAA